MALATKFLNNGVAFTGASADYTGIVLLGGMYAVAVSATWGGGSATLQILMPDASTYVTVLSAFTADGSAIVELPPGTYKVAIATATSVQALIVLIPKGR